MQTKYIKYLILLVLILLISNVYSQAQLNQNTINTQTFSQILESYRTFLKEYLKIQKQDTIDLQTVTNTIQIFVKESSKYTSNNSKEDLQTVSQVMNTFNDFVKEYSKYSKGDVNFNTAIDVFNKILQDYSRYAPEGKNLIEIMDTFNIFMKDYPKYSKNNKGDVDFNTVVGVFNTILQDYIKYTSGNMDVNTVMKAFNAFMDTYTNFVPGDIDFDTAKKAFDTFMDAYSQYASGNVNLQELSQAAQTFMQNYSQYLQGKVDLKTALNNFHSVMQSNFENKFKPYINFIQQTPFKNLHFNNDFAQNYLKKLYDIIWKRETQATGKYLEAAKMFDNTAAFLGYFSEAWKKKGAPKQEFEKIKQEVEDILKESMIKRSVQQGLVELDSQTVQNLTKALSTLVMASMSYGHIINPDLKQAQNYDDSKKTYYAFRLAQQAIREGVLQSYMTYIMNLKSEVAWFYSVINQYCASLNDYQIKLGGLHTQMLFNTATQEALQATLDSFKGGQLSYERILSMLRGVGNIQIQQLNGLGMLTCLQYMTYLEQLKLNITNLELLLANLSAQYAILNNQEKSVLQ